MCILTYNGYPVDEFGILSHEKAEEIAKDHPLRLRIQNVTEEELYSAFSKLEDVKHYLALNKFNRDPMVHKNDILSILGI